MSDEKDGGARRVLSVRLDSFDVREMKTGAVEVQFRCQGREYVAPVLRFAPTVVVDLLKGQLVEYDDFMVRYFDDMRMLVIEGEDPGSPKICLSLEKGLNFAFRVTMAELANLSEEAE